MNLIRMPFPICVSLTLCSLVPAQAKDIPPAVVQVLQSRDNVLGHLTSRWQRSSQEHILQTLSPVQMAAMKQKIERDDPAEYRRQGMTDEARIKRDVQIDLDNVMTALGGGSVSYTNVWSFQRDGSATLAQGTTQQFNGFVGAFRQFYDKDAAMTIFDESHSVKGGKLPTLRPFAWRTSGDSLYYVASSSANLDLLPEHLAFLVGSNPLALRGLTWHLQSQTPASLVLTSSFAAGYTTSAVKMVLSVKNGYAPSEISLHTGSKTQTFTAKEFRRYKDVWMSDRVEYVEDSPKSVHVVQAWTLQSVKPSVPIELKIAQNEPVRDFRLVGTDLSPSTLDKAGMRGDKRFPMILQYRWAGHFPSLKELSQMYEKQNPGESAPDPDQSASVPSGLSTHATRANLTASALPFAGGLMCVVGGVWMFQHRRAK